MTNASGDPIKSAVEGAVKGTIEALFNIFGIKVKFRKKRYKIKDFDTLKTKDRQGVTCKEISLKGRYLEKIKFNVTSDSKYWRAGIKLLDSNVSLLPLLRTDANLLIHLFKDSKSRDINIIVYNDGKLHTAGKKIHNVVANESIKFRIEINKKNWLKCFINNNSEFEVRINSIKRKKICLLAWGDSHRYLVKFRKIKYKLA